jgi:hypothetical protein
VRYGFDAETATLTLEQSVRGDGGNCRQFTLSPDGGHTIFSCGGGEGPLYPGGPLYTVHDRDANDFTRLLQAYVVGPWPLASAYHPELARVAISRVGEVAFFNADSGAELVRVALEPCTSNARPDMFYSPGGRYVYLARSCFSGANISWLIDPVD